MYVFCKATLLASPKKTEDVLTALRVQNIRKQEERTCAVSEQSEIKITSHDVPSQEIMSAAFYS
jgi:hypothetical protein